MKSEFKRLAEVSKASQDKTELVRLLEAVSKVKPKVIVEIGVHQGGSIKTWLAAFNPDLVVGIEKDAVDPAYSAEVHLIQGASQDPEVVAQVKEVLGKWPIDFLFIDGDHTYEAVKQDFELYSPLVRKGGIIAFHDAALDCNLRPEYIGLVEVKRFWDEISQEYKSELLTSENGTGTGIIWKG